MGACASSANPEQAAKDREIKKKMEEDNRKEQEKIKLLLLGAGESGKSTIFKQMKVMYGKELDVSERRAMTPIIYSNVITCVRILIEQTRLKDENLDTVECKESAEIIMRTSEDSEIDEVLGGHIKNVWTDPGIVATWARRSDYQIVESHQAYFDKIDEIMNRDYLASQADILLARVRTSGIVEEQYVIDGNLFCMFDVGGQRNERKKWIHCFEGVTAIIFVGALSEYDQVLYEDANTNRMVEAINLFDEICNNKYFQKTSMLLFLNKKDLYAEKILKKAIGPRDCNGLWEDYSSLGLKDNDFQDGADYFINKFLERNRCVSEGAAKEIYHHLTCATDTENVAVVFNSCKDVIMKQNMAASGFM